MFSKNNVTQSMIDAVESVLAEDKKLLLEPEDEKKDRKKNDEVKEDLKGNQVKLDKNHNGKLDAQDFKLLRMKKEESEPVEERTLTPGETAEKERIVKSMKKGLAGFKARYGDRAKSVMYATATKQAMKESAGAVTVKKEYDDEDEAEHGVYHGKKKIGYVVHDKKSDTHTAYHGHKYGKDDYENSDDFPNHEKAVNQIKSSAGLKEDIGAMQSVVGENKGKKSVRVDTLKGISATTDPEVKNANAHFSGKAATLKAEGKGTETPSTFVTDSATHKEINKAVKPTFKKIKEMLGKTGTSE